MADILPRDMQDAMERLLEAEAESERSPTPAQRMTRIRLLRAAREVVQAWREGRLTTERAVKRLEELSGSLRQA